MNTLELTNKQIESFLSLALDAQANYGILPPNEYFKNVYFAGRTLFFDLKTKDDSVECLTISYTNECFGLFSGGNRKLLSISNLIKLKELMVVCGVTYPKKEIIDIIS